MKKLQEIKNDLKTKLLVIRAIHRCLELEAFKEAFNVASDCEKQRVLEFIKSYNKDELFRWIRKIIENNKSFDCYSTARLRELGKQLGIKDYKFLTKSSLLSEIKANDPSN